MKNDCEYTVDAEEAQATVYIVGHADYLNCAPLRKFLDFTTGTPRYAEVILDFSRCTSIDSTALGIIARAALRLRQEKGRRVVLTNLRNGPLRAATQLGLGHLAGIEDSPEVARRFTPPPFPVREADPVQGVSAETIRDAHEALMEIEPRNREIFADVMSFIGASKRFSPRAETPAADPA